MQIRPALEEDVPLILQFIQELAEYEKLLHEVVADEATLRKHLFGDAPKAQVVFVEVEDTPVGFALFFHNFSTFQGKPGIYLEDLYVRPEHRGKGYGKALLTYLARKAKAEDCGRLQWWVLDWNEPSIQFYKSLSATSMDDWTVYRVDGKALDALAS